MTPTLCAVIEALYDSEINAGISWFYDGGYDVFLGDNLNGIKETASFDTHEEVARWLIDAAKRHYPNSQFARAY